MAKWTIIKDYTEEEGDSANLKGQEYEHVDHDPKKITSIEKFRLFDGDDQLYYAGYVELNEHDTGFEPQDWGCAYAGCTKIEYYNLDRQKWEML